MSHAWGEDRIMTFLPEARQLYTALLKGNKDVRIPPPRFISCWISEVCNLDCTYCYFSETNYDKSHQYINAKRFIEWLSQAKAAGAESLEFSGGGEPTLNPQFKEIYTAARAMGYQLGIITHACNPMPIEDMVRNFKYVRCGLDAATTETHDAIKRNKRKNYWFPKAIENIKELVRLRDELNPDGFAVGIKVVLNKINYCDLQAMLNLAYELKVNYIQIKREHSSDNDLTPEQQAWAQVTIDMGAKGNHSNFTQVKGTMVHARATTKCFMSPIHTVVTATGKILQCCFFEDRPIGTIFEDFNKVWGNEEHRNVIEKTTVAECDKVDCRFSIYNRIMQQAVEDPLASSSFI